MTPPAPVIHCHVPIRVRVRGQPDDRALRELVAAVRRQVQARLEQAERAIDDLLKDSGPPKEGQTKDSGQAKTGGRPAPPPREQVPDQLIPGRDWRVLRALTIKLPVGDFLNFFEEVLRTNPELPANADVLPERVVFQDIENEVRHVTVWLVQTERTIKLGALIDAVGRRAQELLRPKSGLDLAHVGSPSDGIRQLLATIDSSGEVARLPSLLRRNLRRVSGNGSGTELLRGGLMIWAGMELPKVEPRDYLDLGPIHQLSLAVPDVGFCIDEDEFEQVQQIAWVDYAGELGTRPVRVDVMAIRATTGLPLAAAQYLSQLAYDAADKPPPAPGTVPVTVLVTTRTAAPPVVLRQLEDYGHSLDPLPGTGPAGAGQSGAGLRLGRGELAALAVAYLPLDADTLAVVVQSPPARQLAVEVRALLAADTHDRQWKYRLYDWLATRFSRSYVSVRPPGGTTFEFLLAELDRTGDIDRLFDAVEWHGWFALEMRLVLLTMATSYASHPRCVRLLARLRGETLDHRVNRYHDTVSESDQGWIELDKDPERRVEIGVPGHNVLGDVDSIFLQTRKEKLLSSAAEDRLRTAIEAVRLELLAALSSGRDQRVLTTEEYVAEVTTTAVQRAKITEHDFEEKKIERSIRVRSVTRRDIDQLPSWDIEFEIVERLAGSGTWTTVSSTITETADEFEARLIYWQLGRSGEVYEAMMIGITIIGFVAVAWEAGLIAALVDLAGGAKVVATSVIISLAIHTVKVLFFGAPATIEGFFMAAVEGYLDALAFRPAIFLGHGVGHLIGAQTLTRAWTGIVAEKLVVGVVGGGLSAGMNTFIENAVEVVVHDGHWRHAADYIKAMGAGAAMGVLGEFTIAPVLHSLGARGGDVIRSAADLYQQLEKDGYTLAEFVSASTEAMSNLRRSFTSMLNQEVSLELLGAFGAQVEQVAREWGSKLMVRRVLELSGGEFSRTAVKGLERFVAAAEKAGSPDAARRLAEQFADHPQEAVHLMEVLATLDEDAAARLMRGTFNTTGDLAAFLGRIARYGPDQQRGILKLLSDAGVIEAPPHSGMSAAQVYDAQHAVALSFEAGKLRSEAALLRAQAKRKLDEVTWRSADDTRRVDSLRDEAAQLDARAAELDKLSQSLEAGLDPRPAGQRVPDWDVGADPSALERELDQAFAALEAGTGPPPQAWIRLPGRKLSIREADKLGRTVFTSRSGNPVVFRVEGGAGNKTSHNLVHIDNAGNVTIAAGAKDLNLNIGSFDRAIEYLLANRSGARLKVFEVEQGWIDAVQKIATFEKGQPARVMELDPVTKQPVRQLPPAGRIRDVDKIAHMVDTRKADDQLQLADELVPELNEFIIPGSGRVVEFAPRTSAGARVGTTTTGGPGSAGTTKAGTTTGGTK